MTAGASLLDLIGERTSSERAPAVRAFAEAILHRLNPHGADGTQAPDGTDLVILRGRSFAADQGEITGEPFFALTAGRAVVVSRFNPQTGFNDFLSFDAVGNVTDLCAELAA